MAKKIQLNIPEPCHENWDNMTPTEKGRFCGACQKQVIDFTNMSDREIAQFFKKRSSGSTCGQFLQDQLDRDLVIPQKRIPWIRYFFQFAIPAFLASAKINAQEKVKPKEESILSDIKKRQNCDNSNLMPCDTIGRPTRGSVLADTIALTEVKVVALGTVRGKYVVGGYTVVKGQSITQKPGKSDTVINRISNIFPAKFKLYPNPVSHGQPVTIETSAKNDKIIQLTVTDMSGKVLLIQSRQMLKGNNTVMVYPENGWTAGIYLVVLAEENGKLIKEAKLVVQ